MACSKVHASLSTTSYAEFWVSPDPGSKALPIGWLPGFLAFDFLPSEEGRVFLGGNFIWFTSPHHNYELSEAVCVLKVHIDAGSKDQRGKGLCTPGAV